MPHNLNGDCSPTHSQNSSEIIANAIKAIALGKTSIDTLSIHDPRIHDALSELSGTIKKVIKHVNFVAQGRYDMDYAPINDHDELGYALHDMTEMLRDISRENSKAAWIKSGQAELLNIVRADQSSHELGTGVLSFLVRYTNSLMGTLYQVNMDVPHVLNLIGTFAVREGARERETIRFGEGLVGQCAEEREQIVFSDVPSGYMTIGTSLGDVEPKFIIVTPFLIEDDVVGVMELGSVEPFDHTKRELLRQVSRNIAIALKSSQQSEKLKAILGSVAK